MFDGSLPEIPALRELSARELVDAARGWARAENAACARKLAVMAEIFARRTELPAGERELWWVDPETAVAAELAAALDVTQGLALYQTHRGVALRDRLPKVAALFEAGLVSDLLVRAIVWRTYLIDDAAVMAAVDADLAEQIREWGPLSAAKTDAAIDALVERHDPGALRRSRESCSSRNVDFGSPGDAPGLTTLIARLFSADAAVMRERLDRVADSVCEADPRGIGERRSDALARHRRRARHAGLWLRGRRLRGCAWAAARTRHHRLHRRRAGCSGRGCGTGGGGGGGRAGRGHRCPRAR